MFTAKSNFSDILIKPRDNGDIPNGFVKILVNISDSIVKENINNFMNVIVSVSIVD